MLAQHFSFCFELFLQPECSYLRSCCGAGTPATSAEVLVATDACLKAFEEEEHAALKLSLLVNYDLPAKKVRPQLFFEHFLSASHVQALSSSIEPVWAVRAPDST